MSMVVMDKNHMPIGIIPRKLALREETRLEEEAIEIYKRETASLS